MGMNETPVSERVQIAFFGCRNAGKSSLLNAVTGQNLAVVSGTPGTTTDPVSKTMELLPAGPVVFIDTPGLDDVGELGSLRIEKAEQVLHKADLAVLVIDGTCGSRAEDAAIEAQIQAKQIPLVRVINKADLTHAGEKHPDSVFVSAATGEGIEEFKNLLVKHVIEIRSEKEKPIVSDLVPQGAFVILVVPIDKAAPKGRLILPQQQVIRDLLDHGQIPIVVRDSELDRALEELGGKTALVITDSQAFAKVAQIVPRELPLTSFSILFARYKGELNRQLESLNALKQLTKGDKVLISEGCTHHRQCGDIGTVKIPAALRNITGQEVEIVTTSGTEFPKDFGGVSLIIHCGGCMLSEKEMKYRIATANEQKVPITNYGMVLALAAGVLERSLQPLKIKI